MVTPRDYWWSTLTPAQEAWLDYWSQMRDGNADRNGRQPHNGAPVDPDAARAIGNCGMYGEGALYPHLKPVKWNVYREYGIYRLADFDEWIDVKTKMHRYSNNYLPVQKDDPPSWAYALAVPSPHPTYCITCWCWGEEAQREKLTELVPGRPAHNISQFANIMKPMSELLAEVRRRQALQDAGGIVVRREIIVERQARP